MAYQDTWATCQRCGKQFVFGVEEQRRLEQEGRPLAPPALCPACRAGRAQPAPQPVRRPGPRAERSLRPAAGRERAASRLGPGPHRGHVKWYSREKGFGFIVGPDGQEVFFHRSGIAAGQGEGFADGAPVTFTLEETEKGPQAVGVARVEEREA